MNKRDFLKSVGLCGLIPIFQFKQKDIWQEITPYYNPTNLDVTWHDGHVHVADYVDIEDEGKNIKVKRESYIPLYTLDNIEADKQIMCKATEHYTDSKYFYFRRKNKIGLFIIHGVPSPLYIRSTYNPD